MNVVLNSGADSATDSINEAQTPQALIDALFLANTTVIRNRVDESCRTFFEASDAIDEMGIEGIRSKFMQCDAPTQGTTAEAYLDMFDNEVLPHCSHLASPRYLGHMTSPLPQFLPEIGRLVQTLNQNVVKIETSRGLAFLERQVIGMLHREIFGADRQFYENHLQARSSALGIFTSGGTLANISALWTAMRRAGTTGTAENSSPHADKPVIIGSALMHYSFDKGAQLLGAELHKVPVNDHCQIDLDALREAIDKYQQAGRKIACLVAIAGTTDYGSIDALDKIGEIGRQINAHVHVDAAWGGGLILSESNKHLLDGIAQADTVTIDGHKQLMLPLGCGMLFFRDPALSQLTMHHAPYAVRATSFDQGRFTLEGSRPATALYLHAALHIIGKNGYDALFSESLARARYMAQAIEARPEFELMTAPVMNILTYRYIPEKYRNQHIDDAGNIEINRFNIALQKWQRQKGDSFVSRTFRAINQYDNQGLTLLRAVLLNPLTTFEDIDFLLNDQLQIAHLLENEMAGAPATH
ncbi:putative pyridoxal phosphate-dependent transferase [Advenella mimigardefordensis DPN7]|uniref:Putative pyridoxal phosphate-dependent transferase n=2 Tax=Advenella mimigardefordensis TaxID=302406 RepID=W0PGU5_ADVMD|nr:putative pyridoxal phosphate-dependent transferase [Advenella mimigardefordensis DPN7]